MRRRGDGGIAAIAAAAGVSAMTVSRALRGVEGVSPARRAEILRLAAAMNHRPDSNARALASANATLIGVSLPTLFNDVFADVLAGVRAALRSSGYALVVDTTDYDPGLELDWVERVLSWRPAGLILTGTDHAPALRERLVRAGTPTLEIWDHTPDPIDLCVGVDHGAAGALIGAHVAALGYRRPAFVGAPLNRDRRSEDRIRGVAGAFAGVAGGAPLRVARPAAAGDFEAGLHGTEALLAETDQPRPDVIFYLNDHLAFGGLMALGRAGLQAPRDMGVVGFNALGLTRVLPAAMTTVRTPRREMGALAARNLLARLHGARVDRAVALPVEIVPGATTRPQTGGPA